MRARLALIAACVFALDMLTKSAVKRRIPLYANVDVIPGTFRLTHLENTGAAFSLFAESSSPWVGRLLILFSFAAVGAVSLFLWKRGRNLDATALALALFLGGTLGNLCDRLARGTVTDFLDFYMGRHHWPPFNVADGAIVSGALLLAASVLFAGQTRRGKSSGR